MDRCIAVTPEQHRGAMWPNEISPVTASVHSLADLTGNDGDESVAGAGGASSSAGIRGAVSGVAPAGPRPPPYRQKGHALLA